MGRNVPRSMVALAAMTVAAAGARAADSTSAPAAVRTPAIRVAVYDDGGGGGVGPGNVEKCLGVSPAGFTYRRVGAKDIREGVLKEVDVLVQPGGSGSKQAGTLGDAGRSAVREFVRAGGGYVGICAGAYLATTDYSWSLGLINAKVVDRQHWARGTGGVKVRLTDDGKSLLGTTADVVDVYYGQGPLLAPDHKDGLPAYRVLASYETEIARHGAPAGVMRGTTAVAATIFGKGRVICMSPHPEKTKGLDGFIRRAVEWVAGRDATAGASK